MARRKRKSGGDAPTCESLITKGTRMVCAVWRGQEAPAVGAGARSGGRVRYAMVREREVGWVGARANVRWMLWCLRWRQTRAGSRSPAGAEGGRERRCTLLHCTCYNLHGWSDHVANHKRTVRCRRWVWCEFGMGVAAAETGVIIYNRQCASMGGEGDERGLRTRQATHAAPRWQILGWRLTHAPQP